MSETSIEQIVSEKIECFRAHLKADSKSPQTIRIYIDAVERLIRQTGKSPEELTPQDMEGYKAFLAEKYAQGTRCTHISAVNQYTAEMLHRPDLKVRAPKAPKVVKEVLTEDEFRAIQKAASETATPKRDLALVNVLHYCGLRSAEVSALTLSCIDFNRLKVRVIHGKGGDSAEVNVTTEGAKSVKDYIDRERGKPAKGCEQYLFISGQGKPMSDTALYVTVKHLALEAGITKNVSPHTFRHTMITRMAEVGVPVQQIQAQSRHKSLDMVARYTHLSDKTVRDSFDRVFSEEQPKEPVKPNPMQPVAPSAKGSEQIAYARLTHEDVLRARLEGKIDTPTMESMLAHLEGVTTTQIPKTEKPPLGYA